MTMFSLDAGSGGGQGKSEAESGGTRGPQGLFAARCGKAEAAAEKLAERAGSAPRALKRDAMSATYGTTEVVPFPKTCLKWSSFAARGNVPWPKPFAGPSSVFVEKFVVEDGGRQRVRVLGIVQRILDTNQSSLAKYAAVLLTGDFFGHLEDQFHQRIGGQLLGAVKQNARLAYVLDYAFVPGVEILSTVAHRKVRAQAPCPGHPRRLLLTGAAPDGCGIRRRFFDPISATHGLPVVLVGGRAHQADLVVLPIGGAARPGKLV